MPAKPKRPIRRKDAFFGLHFDLHPGKDDKALGRDLTEPMIGRLLNRVRPDYVQYDCKGHVGYTGYPAKVGWPSPGIVKDSLALWRKVTRRHRVGLFIHYSGVWDNVAIEHHPGWARVDAKGKRDSQITSTFGPYVDRLLIPQLKEVAAKYDLDGAWIDGDCWAVAPDYSPAALQAFREATGIRKAPRQRGQPHWDEFLNFNRKQFVRYVIHYVDALHAFKPRFQITSNWMYTTFMPDPVAAPIDFMSGDYSSGDSVNYARVEGRYIASTGMPWDLMAWGFNKAANQPWTWKSAESLMQEASIVLAQGGGFQIYYQPSRAGYIDDWLISIMAKVARFCRARQAVSHRTEPIPQVALVLSSKGFYHQRERLFSPWEGQLNPLRGALHALLELHYSVDILAEHHLTGRLSEYPIVVVPEWSLLPGEFRDELVQYVRGGGRLLLIGAATSRLFERELGVRCIGEPKEQAACVPGTETLGAISGLWQEVKPGKAKTVGLRYPTSDTTRDAACAATISTLGKGQIGAIYGPLGDAYFQTHVPASREFLGGVVSNLFPKPMVEVDGPPCIDVALRRKGGRILIHLTNVAGMQTSGSYALASFIPPLSSLTLRVRLPKKPRKVRAIPRGAPLRHRWSDGILTISPLTLEIHEVIVIEP